MHTHQCTRRSRCCLCHTFPVAFGSIFLLCIQVLCTKYIKGEDQIANLANTIKGHLLQN